MPVSHLLCLVLVAGAEPPGLELPEAPPSPVAGEDAAPDGQDEADADATPPAVTVEVDETPLGVEPLAWGAAAAATGVAAGLALTLPVGLAVGLWSASSGVDFLLAGGVPTPGETVQMILYPVGGLITFWMWTFVALGIPLAALLAPPLTMLGAFYVNRIRMPWIPVAAALTIPRTLGCLTGSCLAFGAASIVGTVSGLLVSLDPAARGLTPAQRNAHPALLFMSAADACLCPLGVMGGTLAGDVVGVALLKPITEHWAARARDEDALPTDLLNARTAPPPPPLDDDD